ncbi:MAG: CCA tRNA nucleotidyltransferase [Alphaproteobacteria bacterium]
MDVAKTITPKDWMTHPATQKVMDVLGMGNTLFVGGCVRNTLLEKPVRDIDLATKHIPDKVIKLLEGQGIKAIPTGIEHGTITAVYDDHVFEITTLRKDVETDGRRAVIAFADTWEEDAQRRDFTMNTLLADCEGNIYDPTGQGIEDLGNRRIRFVGNAETRIREDVLRILRFFRFHAFYGQGEPDEAALEACAKHANKIPELSKERITQEFLKILAVDNPADILGVMWKSGVLSNFVIPSIDEARDNTFEGLKSLTYFQTQYNAAAISTRLFALAGYEVDSMPQLETLLLLPKIIKKDIAAINAVLGMPTLNTDQVVKEALYRQGRTATLQTLMIELSQDRVNNTDAAKALDTIQNWQIPTFSISGEALIAEGFTQGKDLGKELNRREEAWIKSGFNE